MCWQILAVKLFSVRKIDVQLHTCVGSSNKKLTKLCIRAH